MTAPAALVTSARRLWAALAADGPASRAGATDEGVVGSGVGGHGAAGEGVAGRGDAGSRGFGDGGFGDGVRVVVAPRSRLCPGGFVGVVAVGAGVEAPVAVVLDRDDAVVAACGWSTWPVGTAHLGVLTAPSARGRGAARTAASAAVTQVLAAGLLPQWRARIPASRRVAAALGFVEVGAQLSVQVAVRTP